MTRGLRVTGSGGEMEATRLLIMQALLKGSWDLVIGVISKVTTVIITYNPNSGTYNPTY